MSPEQIKERIGELHKKHDAIGNDNSELWLAESYEVEAEDLIVAYCEERGYLVNGFPTEKRNLDDDEHDDEYFSTERFRLYLDTLAVQKDDVAELLYYYNSTFWPNFEETKQEFIERLKYQLENGTMYDVEL